MKTHQVWQRFVARFVALILLGAAASARAQHAPPANAASIAAAMGRYYSGDARGAARILERVTSESPADASAWRLLALCYRSTGALDRALGAYDKALALEPSSPATLFNLAGVLALRGNSDSAFSLLAKLRASHSYDMTQLDVDTAYASLRSDARYAPLLPTASDFSKPFVEDVKVIREIDGEATGDQFGWIARSIGDVDGDGVEDFVTSAPTKSIGGANAGRVYAYSSRSGKLLWSVDGRPGEQLGTGVESAGDVDGDGVQDVIAVRRIRDARTSTRERMDTSCSRCAQKATPTPSASTSRRRAMSIMMVTRTSSWERPRATPAGGEPVAPTSTPARTATCC